MIHQDTLFKKKMIHQGTSFLPTLLLSSLLVSSFVYVVQAGEERNSGRKLAGENPLTAKETLTSYWKNHISNGLPRPQFFMDKVSPLNALDLAAFSKLAEQGSLSTQLHDFCSKANLICGSESSTKLLYQYIAAPKEIKTGRKYSGKYFRESMLKPGTVMPMSDIGDKMPKRSFLPRVIASKLPLTSPLFGQFKKIFQADLKDNKPVSDKKSHYHGGYGDSAYQGSYDDQVGYHGGYRETSGTYHGGYRETSGTYHRGYPPETSGAHHGGSDKMVYHSESKVALHECAVAPNRGEIKKCVGSGEDMIDFATSILGRNLELRTTENTRGINTDVLIGSVKGINAGKTTKLVLFHQTLHPYLVYYCHAVPKVRVYEADILDPATKVKINHGVAICHIDTSSWGSGQEAFKLLGFGPGKIEVCHWIFENDLAWATAD